MANKQVTILIPNYKTPQITTICLRLIRQHTDFERADVIVIDNQSHDASLDYLRSLSWIQLIERQVSADESGPLSHSRALDLALQQVRTPYVISIHTDTFVKNKQWLDVLLAPFEGQPAVAGVGSWKLEYISPLRQLGHQIEQTWKYVLHRYFGYSRYRPERGDVNAQYLRSHCAVYRTEVIRQLQTSFSDGNETAGKVMHQKMLQAGYRMVFLDSATLGAYVDHLNHATMVLNPALGSSQKMLKRGHKRIQSKLRGINAAAILNNPSLDD